MKYDVKIFYKDCDEFEKLRQMAMSDPSNPHTGDFSHDKLVIEDHNGYAVAYDNDKPVVMCGLYPIKNYSGVGRIMNRSYVFPDYRHTTRGGLYQNIKDATEQISKPLLEKSPYHTHIMSMANRGTRNNFFNVYYMMHNKAWPNHWHRLNGFVQTGNGMHKDSWQNVITDNPDFKFKTINYDQWLLLVD